MIIFISSVSVSTVKAQRPRQYSRSQVDVFFLLQLTGDLGIQQNCYDVWLFLKHNLRSLFIIVIVIVIVIIFWPLQSVHSREVDEDEIEAEEALRERDERIRELEVVIMRQVGD